MNNKNVIYGLYCLCHPEDGVRYVGQTRKGMTARFGVHIAHSKYEDAPVYNWIRKHGQENIGYVVLEVCLTEELDSREASWIAQYREERGRKLMNVKTGGATSAGHKNPKRSIAMRGEGNPSWGKDRSEAMAYARSFQSAPSDETKRKIAESLQGHQHTKESRELMSKKQKESWTEERSRMASEGHMGSGNQAAKINEDDVRKIRELSTSGLTYREIAARYPISEGSVSNICRRKTWAHVK